MAATYIGTTDNVSRMTAAAWGNWRERVAGIFWFSICLILFMILGPFAAPIAVCFMFSNRLQGREMPEPESLCEGQSCK